MKKILFFLFITCISTISHAQLIGGTPSQLGPACPGGPPYVCSSLLTTNPGVVSAIFSGTVGQNTTAYDTSINGSGINCITRLTDSTTFPSGASIGNFSGSGGSNDLMWSKNGDYLGIAGSGGFIYIFQLTVTAGCYQVVNTGIPAIKVAPPFAFSPVTDNVFYAMASDHHTLQMYTIASISVMPTPTTIVDFLQAGKCPGWSGLTPNSNAILRPAANDTIFTEIFGNSGQGSAQWVLSYSTASASSNPNSCTALNTQTGKVYPFCVSGCSSSTPPIAGNITGCYGFNMHDAEASLDGLEYIISISGVPTTGTCAGNTNTTQLLSWVIGSLNGSWANGDSNTTTGWCCNHPSTGYTHLVSNNYHGANIRPLSNIGNGFTQFANFVNTEDAHIGWPHQGDDTFPAYIGAADLVLPTQLSGCTTSAVYCPTWPSNMVFSYSNIYATYLPGSLVNTFFHTFSCNALGAPYAHCIDSMVSVAGTTVTWISGNVFQTGTFWNGLKISLGTTQYTVQSVTDNHHLVLTTSPTATSSIAFGIPDPFGGGEAIGVPNPQGTAFAWASSMFHNMGIDNQGFYRVDGFIGRLQ